MEFAKASTKLKQKMINRFGKERTERMLANGKSVIARVKELRKQYSEEK